MRFALIFAVIACFAMPAVAHEGHDPTPVPASLASAQAELAAFAAARPVFERHCFRCHTAAGPLAESETLEHLDMDRYPFASHHGDLTRRIRASLGALAGHSTPEMPADRPGAVQGAELAAILAWADAYDLAHPAAAGGHVHGALPVAFDRPREMLVPGRPGHAGAYHIMINAFGYLQNLGLAGHQVDSGAGRFDGGETDALLTGTWIMGYYRSPHGWVEASAMLNFEPLSVSDGGVPELGQAGEGLTDAQHSHQLLHMAMIAVHPLSGTCGGTRVENGVEPCHDLALFAGQGSATIGPPLFMHRASAPGPTVPRKHHKGENPHETAPVLGATLRWHTTWVEASAFGNRELGPDDSRLRPWPATPRSFAARIRQDLGGWLELQLSGSKLAAQGPGGHASEQLSASAYAVGRWLGWRADALLDWGYDHHDDAHGVLAELALRSPSSREIVWSRGELNQRDESDGSVSSPWLAGTLGFEHVLLAPRGVRLGLFGEATFIHIPDALAASYGRDSAITLDLGLHLFGMWDAHAAHGAHGAAPMAGADDHH
jgi:hypothetical protein